MLQFAQSIQFYQSFRIPLVETMVPPPATGPLVLQGGGFCPPSWNWTPPPMTPMTPMLQAQRPPTPLTPAEHEGACVGKYKLDDDHTPVEANQGATISSYSRSESWSTYTEMTPATFAAQVLGAGRTYFLSQGVPLVALLAQEPSEHLKWGEYGYEQDAQGTWRLWEEY